MEKRIAVIFRHGEFEKQKYGDGPLTNQGKKTVVASAIKLAKRFRNYENISVSAFISGSLRGLDTYCWIRDNSMFQSTRNIEPYIIAMIEGCFNLRKEIISTDYFSTPEDDAFWRSLRQNAAYQADCEAIGSGEALLVHAFDLIKGCADRVVKAIHESKTRVVLVVTHSPHDQLIAEALTGTRPADTLELGCFRIVEFD